MPGDDLTQRLAEVIAIARFGQERWAVMSEATRITQILWHGIPAARAVLASGVVVPTSNVLNLAAGWAHEPVAWECDDRCDTRNECAAELRALTQQETP